LPEGEELGQCIASSENLAPTVQNLPRLLPGFFPSPAVLELVEQIFDRPALAIRQNNPGCGKRQIGAKDEVLFAYSGPQF